MAVMLATTARLTSRKLRSECLLLSTHFVELLQHKHHFLGAFLGVRQLVRRGLGWRGGDGLAELLPAEHTIRISIDQRERMQHLAHGAVLWERGALVLLGVVLDVFDALCGGRSRDGCSQQEIANKGHGERRKEIAICEGAAQRKGHPRRS